MPRAPISPVCGIDKDLSTCANTGQPTTEVAAHGSNGRKSFETAPTKAGRRRRSSIGCRVDRLGRYGFRSRVADVLRRRRLHEWVCNSPHLRRRLLLLGNPGRLLSVHFRLRLRRSLQLHELEPVPAWLGLRGRLLWRPVRTTLLASSRRADAYWADELRRRWRWRLTARGAGRDPGPRARARLARTNCFTSRGPLRRPSLSVRRRKRTLARVPISPVCGIDIVRCAWTNTRTPTDGGFCTWR